jgi:hypothetical protein
MRKPTGLLVLSAGLLVIPAKDASAVPTAGAMIGQGFTDGYNLGIGARAGYSFATKLYVGGTFIYQGGRRGMS